MLVASPRAHLPTGDKPRNSKLETNRPHRLILHNRHTAAAAFAEEKIGIYSHGGIAHNLRLQLGQ